MAFFEVDADASEVIELLKAFEKRAGDLGPTMGVVAEMLVTAVQDEFETEGGGEWPGFADSTLRTRAGGKLLQDKGILAGSISPNSGPRFAEASTGVEYAVHHIFGAPKAGVPQRDFFDIDDDVFEDAAELIATTLAG